MVPVYYFPPKAYQYNRTHKINLYGWWVEQNLNQHVCLSHIQFSRKHFVISLTIAHGGICIQITYFDLIYSVVRMKFNILCGQYFESDKKLLPLMQIACVPPPQYPSS